MASDVLMKELDWSWKKKICSQIGARCDSVSSSMRSRRTWNGVELDCGNERRWTPMIDDRYVTDVTTRSDWKNGPCDAIESTPVEPRPMGGNNNNNNNMKKNKKKSPFFLVLSFQSLEDAGKHPVAIRRKGGVVANAEAIGGGASPFRWMPCSSRNEPDAGRRHLGANGNGDLLGLDFLFAKENSVHSFVYGRVKKKMTITFFVAFFFWEWRLGESRTTCKRRNEDGGDRLLFRRCAVVSPGGSRGFRERRLAALLLPQPIGDEVSKIR